MQLTRRGAGDVIRVSSKSLVEGEVERERRRNDEMEAEVHKKIEDKRRELEEEFQKEIEDERRENLAKVQKEVKGIMIILRWVKHILS